MASRMIFVPVPEGNTEAVRGAFAEMSGSREGQCVANRGVMGVTREYVCLQHTAHGDVLIGYLEGDDPEKASERMMASDSEYARWIADTVMPLMGVRSLDSAEVLADWSA